MSKWIVKGQNRLFYGVFCICVAVLLAAGLSTALGAGVDSEDAPSEAATGATLADTTVQVAFGHFAPFSAVPISTSVEIRLNSTVVVTGLIFGEITSYREIIADDYLMEVIPTGEVEPALVYTLTVAGPGDMTVGLIGNGASYPLEIIEFEDDNTTSPAAGQARLRIAHLAPLPPLVAPSALDICTERNAPPLASNLSYRGSVVIEIPAGIYRTFIATAGANCALSLATLPEFALSSGQIAYAYAVGDGIRAQPTVLTMPDLSVQRVYFPHMQTE